MNWLWRGGFGVGWAAPLVLGLLLAVVAAGQPDRRAVQANLALPAPEFTIQLLVNRRAPLDPPLTTARPLTLAGLRGAPVLLHFWASWSGPANDHAPMIQQFWQEYRARGVMFVGVAVFDKEHNARALVERHRLTYANGVDSDGAIGQSYGMLDVPEWWFIDRAGTVIRRQIGPIGEAELRAALDDLLR